MELHPNAPELETNYAHDPSLPVTEPRPLLVRFTGTGSDLFGIYVSNFFLCLFTLGLYWPWARTRVRQYLWRSTEIDGEPLRYHGKGIELVPGAVVIFLLWCGFNLVQFLGKERLVEPELWLAMAGSLCAFTLPLAAYSFFGSKRYRLTRTSWRGIRFGLEGDAAKWTGAGVLALISTACTLGLAAPVWSALATRRLAAGLKLGGQRAVLGGTDGELIGALYLRLLLTVVTLGLGSSWWDAAKLRHVCENLQLGSVRVRSRITGGDLLRVRLVVVLGLICSLGFAMAWLQVWMRQELAGLIDVEAVGPIEGRLGDADDYDGDAVADALVDTSFDV